ncbi:hypothetical protein GGI06_000737 [Coemansia sp. S85]|nr:hypothetical protein GGI06_000737 [Coemansia sp. S85]
MADQADNEIKTRCKREVWEHAHRLKEVITGRVDAIPSFFRLNENGNRVWDSNAVIDDDLQSTFRDLWPALSAYPAGYKFAKNSRYYDIKASPEHHLLTFYKVRQPIEQNSSGIKKKRKRNKKMNSIQCFPIWKLFIPLYTY